MVYKFSCFCKSFFSVYAITAFFIIISLASCNEPPRKSHSATEKTSSNKELFVGANKILVRKDHERIKSYVKRREWDMQPLENGLWAMIYEKGQGPRVKTNNYITLKYTIQLLDGTICYSSDSLGPKTFRVGYGNVAPGLEEAVLLLNQGDKAKFILPPFLGYGLSGDENKIPPRAILLYDIEVTDLK